MFSFIRGKKISIEDTGQLLKMIITQFLYLDCQESRCPRENGEGN